MQFVAKLGETTCIKTTSDNAMETDDSDENLFNSDVE